MEEINWKIMLTSVFSKTLVRKLKCAGSSTFSSFVWLNPRSESRQVNQRLITTKVNNAQHTYGAFQRSNSLFYRVENTLFFKSRIKKNTLQAGKHSGNLQKTQAHFKTNRDCVLLLKTD